MTAPVLAEADLDRLVAHLGCARADVGRVARNASASAWLVVFTDGTTTVVTDRQLTEVGPIGVDSPIVEWPPGVDRDGFVMLLSQCVDACALLGHDVPFDGPQLVAWLESPIRRERALASHHVAAMRKTLAAAKDELREGL